METLLCAPSIRLEQHCTLYCLSVRACKSAYTKAKGPASTGPGLSTTHSYEFGSPEVAVFT